MSPAQVVLAGGAGLASDIKAACDTVFQQFDPPIVVGTYDSVSKDRRAKNKSRKSDYRKGQSEHGIANSAFQSDRGNNASNVLGAEGYTEGSAFAFSVFDGQSAGTEHKWLTDAAKDFHESLQAPPSKEATLKEHLDASEKNWEKSFEEKLERKKGEKPRSRIKDADKKTKQERKDLAKAAAKCLRLMAEAQFAKQKIPLDTKLRNGLSNDVKFGSQSGSAGGNAL